MTPQFLASLNDLEPSTIGFILVPAALASALMGKKGGKIADLKGNMMFVFVASTLLFSAFFLLSTFVGQSIYINAAILILANVGQTFMQVSMSNTVSQSLPKEATGVGMGLLSMINFISGAMSMSIVGKLLDQGTTNLQFNLLNDNQHAFIYSNILLVMAGVILCVLAIYKWQLNSPIKK